MSSTTHNLPFVRFARQVRTEPIAVLATDAAAIQAETLLRAAPWEKVDEQQTSFPARSATQDGYAETWDAFKHVGNYAAGYQRAYTGMVAYRYQIPAAAISGPVNVTKIAVPIYVDRWLVDGVRVAALLSDDLTPPTDWATLREGSVYEDDVLPMEYTDDTPPVRIVVEKSSTIELTLSAAPKKFLYVFLSLEDYQTTRGFWIEGASFSLGADAVTTFASAIAADPATTIQRHVGWIPVQTPVFGVRDEYLSCSPDAAYMLNSFVVPTWADAYFVYVKVSSNVAELWINGGVVDLATLGIPSACPFAGTLLEPLGYEGGISNYGNYLEGTNRIAIRLKNGSTTGYNVQVYRIDPATGVLHMLIVDRNHPEADELVTRDAKLFAAPVSKCTWALWGYPGVTGPPPADGGGKFWMEAAYTIVS
jgi:hypothetical protein